MKRNYKTVSEWKKAYRDKEKLMNERGFSEVKPKEFYRALFPAGSLQRSIGDGKGNVIASQLRPKGEGKTRQWIVDDTLERLDKVVGDSFGLIPPISFFGKSHTKENAHQLFAMVIDIDYVGLQQLKNMLKQFGNGVQLCPSFLVSSGKGVHLYYLFQEPIELYHNMEKTLAELKEALIRRNWNDTSSIRPDNPDITGIYQGFRCVGSLSKLGEGFPVKAWQLTDQRYTLEEIKASIPSCKVDLSLIYEKPKQEKRKKGITLEEAKELYPAWYQLKIVEGQSLRRTWTCKPALYEWWKHKMSDEVKVGGRYFSIMALCAYGLKCGISERQIKQDAYSFLEHLESLTEDEDNHFTKSDIQDAFKALKADNRFLSTIASRAWIEKTTKVSIPPNKRNYRKQEVHLKIARATLVIMNEDNGKPLQGRPEKAKIVEGWQRQHPEGKKIECERETGLSRHTV
ncbi:repa, partial [Agathobaculum desmolans]|uniref:repa n=1 Tax=Agathobaculum desmolans TaxID=39484 RepID=UPI00068FC509